MRFIMSLRLCCFFNSDLSKQTAPDFMPSKKLENSSDILPPEIGQWDATTRVGTA